MRKLLSRLNLHSALLISILTFAGCEAHDLGQLATLAPTSDSNVFIWETFGDAVYPENSSDAEAGRIRQLDERLKKNNLCGNGYSIIERRAILKNRGALGNLHDIFYTIRCR